MPNIALWTRVFALMAMLLGLAGTAQAESADATDEAFAALLAMPEAQPRQGQWIIPEQTESAPQSEKALIARLGKLKKKGANFNAIRHRGTLLAHAIRADMERTALWLLSNGADTKHVLFYPEQTSAYDLALQFERTAVVKVLEGQYGFKPKPLPSSSQIPPGRSANNAVAAPTPPLSRVDQAAQLMAKLSRTPYPKEAAQLEWQKFAVTLSPDEYVALFKDGTHLDELIYLVREFEGGLENALSRLPRDLVRSKAQQIADILADVSYVNYSHELKISYNVTSRSWPALWRRIDQPLRYDNMPELVARIPSALWPALFASGYLTHDAEVTGCLLSAVDTAQLKALWPDFQRFFANARETAISLVLGKYRLAREASPCYYSSSTDTLAKLEFLRQLGVSSQVIGLRQSLVDGEDDPALKSVIAALTEQSQRKPRLVSAPPTCELALNEIWLNALVRGSNAESVPEAMYAQAIDVPGQRQCGLLVGVDEWRSEPEASDNFEGPMREGSLRCADLPDHGGIWIEEANQIQQSAISDSDCQGGCAMRKVKDTQTGKHFMLNEGKRGARCSVSWQLPDAFEWQSGPKGAKLIPSHDAALVDKLLREQCREAPESEKLSCRGIDDIGDGVSEPKKDGDDYVTTLRQGGGVYVLPLVDQIGKDRKAEYAVAIAAHDNALVRKLLSAGIPATWTAAEIRALGTAELSLAEKRRRIALLFSNAAQLNLSLKTDRYNLPESLLAWLPSQDWTPILRIIAQSPDDWRDAAGSFRKQADEAKRFDLTCAVDHALGFLCGGGVEFD